MRITILLLIYREEQEFVCKYLIFQKFDLKCLKNNFLKISLCFLVENVKPFHMFTVNNEGEAGIFYANT